MDTATLIAIVSTIVATLASGGIVASIKLFGEVRERLASLETKAEHVAEEVRDLKTGAFTRIDHEARRIDRIAANCNNCKDRA